MIPVCVSSMLLMCALVLFSHEPMFGMLELASSSCCTCKCVFPLTLRHADHAAALGALGLLSNHHINVRLASSSARHYQFGETLQSSC